MELKPQHTSLIILGILLLTVQTVNCRALESTLVIQPSVGDTFVNSMYLHTKYPEEPHGYLWALFAGNMYVEYNSYKLYGNSRIYIKFNITSIPQDAKILSANMCLYMYDPPKTSQEFETHRVMSDWNEHKLTWRTQPPYVKAPTSTTIIRPTPIEAWVCWDITSDLKMWHSRTANNYGTMIKIKNEINASDQLASYYPKQALQPDERKPKLVVRVDWYKPITTASPTASSSPTSEPSTSTQSPKPTSTVPPPANDGPKQSPEVGDHTNPTLIIQTSILVSAAVVGVILILHIRSKRKKPIRGKTK
ncbi:DNRLRE domain-containing protein [Candidatus Bathyarchaeota archaeon]|nr:DNRLRE domain-containing protein [Candidatus Bathyarchaeota archaeon]